MIEKRKDLVNLVTLESASLEQPEQTVSAARSPMAIIARNSAFVKVLGFLFNVYVVRRLGDVHFGQYSAVMAYVAMFAIFTDWGMSPYALPR
jgi:hypothetical protein